MKAILCLLSVLVATVCINCQISPEAKQRIKECHAEVGIPYNESHTEPLNIYDRKVRCLLACELKKKGGIVDGKLKPEINHLDKRVQEKILECVNIANEETDECDVAAVMQICLLKLMNRKVCMNCQISPEAKQRIKECHAEVGIPYNESHTEPVDIYDRKVRCLIACELKKKGGIVDGKLKPEMNHLDKGVQEDILQCANKANEETDECDVAAVMQICLLKLMNRKV